MSTAGPTPCRQPGIQHRGEQLALQVVHQVVLDLELAGQVDVPLPQHHARLVGQVHPDPPHPLDDRPDLRRNDRAGCRRRAALATWIANAPIRCRSATIQIADTTVRRSEATGASKASSSTATFSAFERISSSRTSDAMTCLANAEVGVQQRPGGVAQRIAGDHAHGQNRARRGRRVASDRPVA